MDTSAKKVVEYLNRNDRKIQLDRRVVRIMNKSFIRSKINTIENIIFESSSANITESKKVQYEYELLNIFELLFATQLSDVESQNYCDYMNKSLSEEDLNQVVKYAQDLKHKQSEYLFERYSEGYRAVIPSMVSYRGNRSKMYFNKKKYVYYIFEKLIMQYDIEHKIDKLADATIIIVDHQPNTKGKIRDNDNSDSHDIINLINKYILSSDDNGLLVSLCYDSVISDTAYTELYILPKVKSLISKLAT